MHFRLNEVCPDFPILKKKKNSRIQGCSRQVFPEKRNLKILFDTTSEFRNTQNCILNYNLECIYTIILLGNLKKKKLLISIIKLNFREKRNLTKVTNKIKIISNKLVPI